MLGQSNIRQIQATILMQGFQIHGMVDVYGPVAMFVNDDQRTVFTVQDVTVYGVQAGNPARSMHLSELYIPKREVHLITFEGSFTREDTMTLPRQEHLTVYTSHYALDAIYHVGQDVYLNDFVETFKSQFLTMTDANIFPLFEAQAAVLQQAELAFVHCNVVCMHHPA